jgi:hypothetical protein
VSHDGRLKVQSRRPADEPKLEVTRRNLPFLPSGGSAARVSASDMRDDNQCNIFPDIASLICPTGAPSKILSSVRNKKIPVFRISDLAYGRITPRRHEGRYASSRTWSGMRWTRDVLIDERHGRGRRSRVVLAPQGLAPSWRRCLGIVACDGGKRDGSPGRARINRKPLRREGRL